MIRLTKTLGRDNYFVETDMIELTAHGVTGEAIDRLARFENVYDDLVAKQEAITRELEKLRQEDKTHTVKFKQLVANKLTNSNILILFQSYGIK